MAFFPQSFGSLTVADVVRLPTGGQGRRRRLVIRLHGCQFADETSLARVERRSAAARPQTGAARSPWSMAGASHSDAAGQLRGELHEAFGARFRHQRFVHRFCLISRKKNTVKSGAFRIRERPSKRRRGGHRPAALVYAFRSDRQSAFGTQLSAAHARRLKAESLFYAKRKTPSKVSAFRANTNGTQSTDSISGPRYGDRSPSITAPECSQRPAIWCRLWIRSLPLGAGGQLTDREAWDLEVFVDSHARPGFSPPPPACAH